MVLKPQDQDAFENIERDLEHILDKVRKIRRGMQDSGMERVQLQADKFAGFLDYLSQWSDRAETEFNIQLRAFNRGKEIAHESGAGRPRKKKQ